jgi:hypothetical protein
MRRPRTLAALGLLAAFCGLFLLRPADPFGAALARVRKGMNKAAVVAPVSGGGKRRVVIFGASVPKRPGLFEPGSAEGENLA